MINKKILGAVLSIAPVINKDQLVKELINHIQINYDYNDRKSNHIMEMLIDPKACVELNDVNEEYIKEHPNLLYYKPEECNFRNIKIVDIDNIDGVVYVEYEKLEKINEDRGDVDYATFKTSISYIDFPDILNIVK